jgi:hypothetical protein
MVKKTETKPVRKRNKDKDGYHAGGSASTGAGKDANGRKVKGGGGARREYLTMSKVLKVPYSCLNHHLVPRNTSSNHPSPEPLRSPYNRTSPERDLEKYGPLCEQDGRGWELYVPSVERPDLGSR